LAKTYWVQVEGVPTPQALAKLRRGVDLGDFLTRPAQARLAPEPDWIWPRQPPVRYRKNIPTSWLELVLNEGKNRQVRRMTAAVGYPTLRLIRFSVGAWSLAALPPGAWRELINLDFYSVKQFTVNNHKSKLQMRSKLLFMSTIFE